MVRKNFLSIGLAVAVVLAGVPQHKGFAQAAASPSATTTPEQDMELLRKDIRSEKKQIIAANLTLTDAEAQKFWPVYDQYTAELVKINDAKYGAIKEYATNYDTLTDDKAVALSKQIMGVDKSVAELRAKYVPIVNKVLSGKKTALFFQLDRRLVMLIDLQIAAAIPVVAAIVGTSQEREIFDSIVFLERRKIGCSEFLLRLYNSRQLSSSSTPVWARSSIV